MQKRSAHRDNLERLLNKIVGKFEERGYEIIDVEQFKSLLIKNILHSDVPLFTENNGKLYYQGKEIGVRKKEQ